MRQYKCVWAKHLYLVISIAFFACTILTGCKDEDPNLDHDDDMEVPAPAPLPTEDIIETRVNALTAIYADNPDEMSALFLNRLESGKIESEISSETELVIFDEQSAAEFVKDREKYELLESFYLRGGLIFFHKPALQATALIARLQLEIFNEVPEETIPALYDAYIFNIQGAEYSVDDIHTNGPRETICIDEDGNTHVETIDNIQKPSEYLYGRYAENAAKFVNEALDASIRAKQASYVTRSGASPSEPPLIPIQWDETRVVSHTWDEKKDHMHKTVTITAQATVSAMVKIRCAYSFDQDKDYYQFTLTGFYPGSNLYKGHETIKHGIYKDKYGGFAAHSIRVEAHLRPTDAQLYAIEGIAPDNHPATGTEERVTGWTFGGTMGLTYPFSVAVNPAVNYTSTTSISMPFSEMPVTFLRNNSDGSDIQWTYNVSNPMKYTWNFGRNGSVNDFPDISIQDFSVDQTWSWIFSNTSKLGEDDIKVFFDIDYFLATGMATGGAGKNTEHNGLRMIRMGKEISLPTPHRYKDKIAVVAQPINSTSSTLRRLISDNSPEFRFINDNPDRTGIVRRQLIEYLSEEWEKVYKEVKRLEPFSGVDEDVTFTYRMSDGERIPIGNTGNTGIHIDKNGNVSMVK